MGQPGFSPPQEEGGGAETAPAEVRKVVQFLLGKDLFSLPIEDVALITRAEGVVPLPRAPDFIAGVVNLQGRLSSVVSLERVFGVKGGAGASLIVLVPEKKSLALLVDATVGIGEYTLLEEVGADASGSAGETALVEGVFRRGPRLISLVSTRKLLAWIEGMMRKGEA
jgi:purine-binding chemotaxis protein CheW